jgi:ABC-2 type transport system ATP-binding protein
VSSHLLAEVEQTCTHAVVMNQGKVIASGLVSDLVAAAGPIDIRVDDVPAAVEVLEEMSGIGHVVVVDGVTPRIRVDAGSVGVPEIVHTLADRNVAIRSVTGSTRLEDVFLALVHDPRSAVASDEEQP